MDAGSGGRTHEQRRDRNESPPHGIGRQAERVEGGGSEQRGVTKDDERELPPAVDPDHPPVLGQRLRVRLGAEL